MTTKYELMHRDVPAAMVGISEDGSMSTIVRILDPDHMPPGAVHDGAPDNADLEEWWSDRAIPSCRPGVGRVLGRMGCTSTEELMTGSSGLSLSDCWWIRPPDGSSWEERNLFDNPFPMDIGDLLFGKDPAGTADPLSPDTSTDGVLRKRWIVDPQLC